MKKIIKVLLNCLLVLIILVLVSYFALRMMNKIRIYNVETGSMEDKIHPGDYILLIKKDNYYVGDVVTFRINDYFITHRIIKIEDGKITTKGDANNMEDAEITFEQIEGKAIYWGGILNFIIKFKYVLAAFILGLYLLSCYFGDGKDEIIFEEDSDEKEAEQIDEINEIEEVIGEEKTEEKNDDNVLIEEIIEDEEKKEEDLKENVEEKVVIEKVKEEKPVKKKTTKKSTEASKKTNEKKIRNKKTNGKANDDKTKNNKVKESKTKNTKKK